MLLLAINAGGAGPVMQRGDKQLAGRGELITQMVLQGQQGLLLKRMAVQVVVIVGKELDIAQQLIAQTRREVDDVTGIQAATVAVLAKIVGARGGMLSGRERKIGS